MGSLVKTDSLDLLEDLYGSKLSDGMGCPGKNVRMAFGSQIIKHKLNLSDAEVVEQIRENPYLHEYTHLQFARTDTQTKNCKRVCF